MTDHVRLDDLEARPGATALEGDPRVLRLALDAGEGVPPHDHPGSTVVLFVVSGALEAALDDSVHELIGGELLRFGGDRSVAITALESAVALVFLVDS